jgi:predicted nucleic acid-binding protein
MREAVPDWEVEECAWQSLASGLKLPDPDDICVLAAALAGHADCIVTANPAGLSPRRG